MEDFQPDKHIFQMGWFNHQPGLGMILIRWTLRIFMVHVIGKASTWLRGCCRWWPVNIGAKNRVISRNIFSFPPVHKPMTCEFCVFFCDYGNLIGSMYGIFSYIYHANQPNVGIYTIHGSYGMDMFACYTLGASNIADTWKMGSGLSWCISY